MGRRATTSVRTWSTSSCRMINDSTGIRPDRPFFAYLPFGATHAPAPGPGVVPGEVPGPLSTRAGTSHRRALVPNASSSSASSRRRHGPLAAPQPRGRGLGRPAREPPAPGLPAPGGLRRLPRPHRRPDRSAHRRAPGPRSARQHHRGGPGRQRCLPGGWALRGDARDEVLQRDRRVPRRGHRPHRRHRRPEQPHQLPVGLGPVRQQPRSAGTSRTPTRAGSTCRWSSTGRTGSMPAEIGARCADQFVNVSDIAPTIYDLLGMDPTDGVRRVASSCRSPGTVVRRRPWPTPMPRPPTGSSTSSMFGSRALVVEQDGRWWKAVAKHNQGEAFDDDRWELYDLDADPVGVRRPGRGRAGEAGRADRPLVRRGRPSTACSPSTIGPSSCFASRPDDRSPHPTISPLPLPAADDPDADGGGHASPGRSPVGSCRPGSTRVGR